MVKEKKKHQQYINILNCLEAPGIQQDPEVDTLTVAVMVKSQRRDALGLREQYKMFRITKLISVASFAAQIWKLYLIPGLSFVTEFTCLLLVKHSSKAGVLIPWWVLSGYYWEVKEIFNSKHYEFKLQASSKAWSCVTRLESLWAQQHQNHPVHARGSSVSHPQTYPMTGRFWHH